MPFFHHKKQAAEAEAPAPAPASAPPRRNLLAESMNNSVHTGHPDTSTFAGGDDEGRYAMGGPGDDDERTYEAASGDVEGDDGDDDYTAGAPRDDADDYTAGGGGDDEDDYTEGTDGEPGDAVKDPEMAAGGDGEDDYTVGAPGDDEDDYTAGGGDDDEDDYTAGIEGADGGPGDDDCTEGSREVADGCNDAQPRWRHTSATMFDFRDEHGNNFEDATARIVHALAIAPAITEASIKLAMQLATEGGYDEVVHDSQAADIHEYDRDIDDHNVATWREEAVEKKEITQMEELEELIEVSSGPQLHKYEREMDKLDSKVHNRENLLENLDALFNAALDDFAAHTE